MRFDDVMQVSVTQRTTWLSIDPCYLDAIEPGTVQLCGCVPNEPVAVGAVVINERIRVRLPRARKRPVNLVIRLTAIRKGFRGLRLPSRTREQFVANERFLSSAYAGAGR